MSYMPKLGSMQSKNELTGEKKKRKMSYISPAGEHAKAHGQSSWGAKIKRAEIQAKLRLTGEQNNRKLVHVEQIMVLAVAHTGCF